MKKSRLGCIIIGCLLFSGCTSYETIQKQKSASSVTDNEIPQSEKIFINPTAENKKKFAELKTDDYSYLQQKVIDGMKKQLPIQMDEFSAVTDIGQDRNTLIYKLDVKGIPPEFFQNEMLQPIVNEELKKLYCSSENNIMMIRALFNSGIISHYYINGKRVLTLKITPKQCKK